VTRRAITRRYSRTYSDGYKKTLKAFIHGGLVAPNNCDKMVHLNMTEPVMVG